MKHRALRLILLLVLGACSGDRAPLIATDVAVSKPKPGMRVAAGYITLSNNTTETITITRVTSPEFKSVEMHESILEDGISRMYALDEVTIPAGQNVAFEPGGKHLMLMNPTSDADSATLAFYADNVLLLSVNATFAD